MILPFYHLVVWFISVSSKSSFTKKNTLSFRLLSQPQKGNALFIKTVYTIFQKSTYLPIVPKIYFFYVKEYNITCLSLIANFRQLW